MFRLLEYIVLWYAGVSHHFLFVYLNCFVIFGVSRTFTGFTRPESGKKESQNQYGFKIFRNFYHKIDL